MGRLIVLVNPRPFVQVLIDPPMMPFTLAEKIAVAWALGDNSIGWSFADVNFQAFCNERYAILRRTGVVR